MDDHDHPELDWDPLDDTKVWPENDFPLRHVGTMVLDRAPENFFAESEQIAFGTGVLVDGLDFSDDKMLVGPDVLLLGHAAPPGGPELPAAAGQLGQARAGRDQPARRGDDLPRRRRRARTRSVNYEPSITRRAPARRRSPAHDEQGPVIEGRLTRKRIPRTDDYTQAGERYLLSEQWEKDELVANFVGNLSQCDRRIQERMVWHLFMAEDELGRARRRGPRHHRRRRPRPRAARDADADRGGARPRREPRQQRPARRRGQGHDPLRPERAGRAGGRSRSRL